MHYETNLRASYKDIDNRLRKYQPVRRMLPAPVLALPTIIRPKPMPMWRWIDMEFDHHVTAWRIEHVNPTRAYLRRRCYELGVSFEDIIGTSRTHDLIHPRQLLMWETKTVLGKSYPEIGRLFRKDHTTILWAVKKIERLKAEGKI